MFSAFRPVCDVGYVAVWGKIMYLDRNSSNLGVQAQQQLDSS